MRARLTTLLLAVVFFACAACDGFGAPVREVESGFDPAVDALGFPNFAGFVSTAVFDAEGAYRLYGERACARVVDGRCELNHATQQWIDEVNGATRGGLCEGFAALSHLVWSNQVDLADLGVSSTSELERSNAEVDATLAYWFATQYAPRVSEATRVVTATELAERLTEAFAAGPEGETYRLGILRVDNGQVHGGHALTPYALYAAGEDQWEVAVYDSNFPGEERRLRLDLDADTWAYVASVNPDEPAGLYAGGPGNFNPIYLTPNASRIEEQPCAHCGADGDSDVGQSVGFHGAMSVQVFDDDRRVYGPHEDGLHTDEEGVRVTPVLTGLGEDDSPWTFTFDQARDLSVVATPRGDPLGEDDAMIIASYRGDSAAAVRGAVLGGSHQLDVPLGAEAVSYATSTNNGGPLELSFTDSEGRQVRVSHEVDTTSTEGVMMDLSVDEATGEVQASVDVGGEGVSVRIEVSVSDDEGAVSSAVVIEDLAGGATVSASLDDFDGSAIEIGIDFDGDGAPDEVRDVLPCADPSSCPSFGNDGDIVPTEEDNCPQHNNPDQADLDGDGIGDVCDGDRDGDGVSRSDDCDDLDPANAGVCRCAPGFVDDDGDTSTACVVCEPGRYCPGGNDPASVCAVGEEDIDQSASTPCVVCAAGGFCAGGAAACTPCAPGAWDDDASAATACVACDPGTTCAGGTTPPVSCAPGSWDDDSDPSTVCALCAAGEHCAGGTSMPAACAAGTSDHDGDPATACAACPTGGACEGGAAPFVACMVGTADTDLDPATGCATCAPGTSCPGGSAQPLVCPSGSWDDDSDASTGCAVCSAGEYCAGELAPPEACAAGSWDDDGMPSTVCAACAAGAFCAGGTAAPEDCAAGEADDDDDPATACAACAVGTYCAGGAAAAETCAAGTWDDDSDSGTPCATCAAGTYCAGGPATPEVCAPTSDDDDDDPATPCRPRIAWATTWGGPLQDGSNDGRPAGSRDQDVAVDAAGNVYVVTTWTGSSDFYGLTLTSPGANTAVLAFSATGVPLWVAHLSPAVGGRRLTLTSDGGVIVGGGLGNIGAHAVTTYAMPSGAPQPCAVASCEISTVGGAFILRLDAATGGLAWATQLGNNDYTSLHALDVDGAGDVVSALQISPPAATVDIGGTGYDANGNGDGLVVRLGGATGAALASFQLNTATGEATPAAITVMADGDYVVAGRFGSDVGVLGTDLIHDGGYDAWAARVSSAGIADWVTVVAGNADYQEALDLAPASDDGVYVAGHFQTSVTANGTTTSVTGGNYGRLLAKVDAGGAISWASTSDGLGFGAPMSVGIRRVLVDDQQPSERVRFATLMFAGDTFGGLAMPGPGGGEIDTHLRLVAVDGQTGQIASAADIDAFFVAQSVQLGVPAAALHPSSGAMTLVGFFSANVTLDNTALVTAGAWDQMVVQLNR